MINYNNILLEEIIFSPVHTVQPRSNSPLKAISLKAVGLKASAVESNWCVHTIRRRTDVCTKLYNVMWADVSRDYITTMYSDAEEAVALAVVACLKAKEKKESKKTRSCWTRRWLLRRNMYGVYHCPLQEFAAEDRRVIILIFLRMRNTNLRNCDVGWLPISEGRTPILGKIYISLWSIIYTC